MKQIKLALISLLAASVTAQAAREFDFVKGVDITALTNVTASQLNQLVDAASPNTNKGLIIYSPTAPSTNLNPRYTRFIWLDTSTQPPMVRTYNTSTGVWDPASIANGAVTTPKLAGSAVTGDKIAGRTIYASNIVQQTITATEIEPLTITGSQLATNAVTYGKIAEGAVLNYSISNGVITANKLANGTLTGQQIAANSISNSHLTGWMIQSTNIATNGVVNYNLSAGCVSNTQIAVGTIAGTNLQDYCIGTNHLSTNVWLSYMPRVVGYMATNTSGTIRGATYSTAANKYRVVFDTPFTSTNYVVSVAYINAAANGYSIKYWSNSVSEVFIGGANGSDLNLPAAGVSVIIYPGE